MEQKILKIIFLDYDGCINHEIFYRDRANHWNKAFERPYPLSEIDERCVDLLNYIIQETGAKVVISSSWRHGRSVQELQNILEQLKFEGEIIDVTPSFSTYGDDEKCRGDEVAKWIADNEELIGCKPEEYKNWVALDDDNDFLPQQKNNFIWVDPYIGITPKDAEAAIRILNDSKKTDNEMIFDKLP